MVNAGIRLESLGYTEKYLISNTTKFHLIGVPLSGYLKASINFYDKYEFEIKGGLQIVGDPFTGSEYALLLKYNLGKNIYSLLSFLNHFNFGESRTGSGTYNYTLKFIGAGVEDKLTKLIGMDLIYYLPIGETGLGYKYDFVSNDYRKITTEKVGSLIKLGFIFNIIHF